MARRARAEGAKYPRTSEREQRLLKPVLRFASRLNTAVFRATGGRLGGRFPGGAPVGLLTTTGRKSGRERTLPLVYARDGERVLLVASQAGMPRHPLWYRNLEANPDVSFQIGGDVRRYRARAAGPDELAALWKVVCEVYADFDEYRKRTDREIPLVILEPAASDEVERVRETT